VLEEPDVLESNRATLKTTLRSVFSTEVDSSVEVESIDDNDPLRVQRTEKWISVSRQRRLIQQVAIKAVTKIHSKERLSNFRYHHPMPDIESLMSPWSEEVADILTSSSLDDCLKAVDSIPYRYLVASNPGNRHPNDDQNLLLSSRDTSLRGIRTRLLARSLFSAHRARARTINQINRHRTVHYRRIFLPVSKRSIQDI